MTHYTRMTTAAGGLCGLMSADQESQLIGNLVGALKSVPRIAQERQRGHYHHADAVYGARGARSPDIAVEAVVGQAA